MQTPAHSRLAKSILAASVALLASGCLSEAPDGLLSAAPAATTVELDFYHRPLPRIPLPNDVATRHDPTSPTGMRINASMLAPTELEVQVRTLIDELDGWGVFQHITIPFSGPLDVASILAGHRDADYDTSDDVVYLINIDPASAELGRLHHVDLGQGSYPVVLERQDYWKNDPRGQTISLIFDEVDEDRDGDGVLDLGGDSDGDGVLTGDEWPEDSDADGVLDRPNYLPGASPAADDLAGRSDALMTFYERETDTLIMRPLMPLRERTRYAVVVTRRLLDADGEPVGSPYPGINHNAQTEDLRPLLDVLPDGLAPQDIAFTFSFTTASIQTEWQAVRDGLYGHGVQGHIGAGFPPDVTLEPIRDLAKFEGATNAYVVYAESVLPFIGILGSELLGLESSSQELDAFAESLAYIDYFVIGSYRSPQLFERIGDDGGWKPFNLQSWPQNLAQQPAATRSEDVFFWAMIPRKEVSVRAAGEQAPVAFVGHGYSSNRLEALTWSGYLAKHGVATFSIDCPSHGIALSESERKQAGLLSEIGLGGFLDNILKDRAHDQNGSGEKDSGADFWTSYLFHTRDMVRQCALDYMQLVRILRTWDGEKRWIDLDGDGQPERAGDFDGDGVVDVGDASILAITGSSLGGIMASMVGALEPEMDVTIPVSSGGGLSDVGTRSLQGGVREAVQLRLLSPLYSVTIDPDAGGGILEAVVPDLNDDATLRLAVVPDVRPGDTLLAVNLDNDERGCGFLDAQGRTRAGLPSDLGDRVEIRFYRGPQLAGLPDCVLREGAPEPYAVVAEFEEEVLFQAQTFASGSPLVSLAEGLALPRATPKFRRFINLAQLVLDVADPAVFSPHLLAEPLHYPGTGDTTGTHTLVTTTLGDMNVPASTGLTLGRTASIIDYQQPDPRYGKPANQVVIDTYAAEAVHTMARWRDSAGEPVVMDIDNWSDAGDVYGATVPRLDPPLRLVGPDPRGGMSGAIFPYQDPRGKHDIAFPGVYGDIAVERCLAACEQPDAPVACDACRSLKVWDVGHFYYNVIGRFISSRGRVLDFAACNAYDACPDLPELPRVRADSELN